MYTLICEEHSLSFLLHFLGKDIPMMIGEMFDNGDIPTRLHNGLLIEFRKRLYEPLENMDLEIRRRYPEHTCASELFESMTLAEVLDYLNVSKPEDILKFENCGKKTVEDLRRIHSF